MLYILCGISGVGKTTILNAMLQQDPRLGRLITYTTRRPRPQEINHADYHFIGEQPFQDAAEDGRIVCPVRHQGAWYGTALADLHACAYRDTLAVLRPDKIRALQAFTPTPLLGIYLTRPDFNQPHSEDDYIIIAHQHLCTYQITNIPGHLDQAVRQILALIQEASYAKGGRHADSCVKIGNLSNKCPGSGEKKARSET